MTQFRAMNINLRSLVFSLIFHGFLVSIGMVAGIGWEGGPRLVEPVIEKKMKVIPIRLANPPQTPKAIAPSTPSRSLTRSLPPRITARPFKAAKRMDSKSPGLTPPPAKVLPERLSIRSASVEPKKLEPSYPKASPLTKFGRKSKAQLPLRPPRRWLSTASLLEDDDGLVTPSPAGAVDFQVRPDLEATPSLSPGESGGASPHQALSAMGGKSIGAHPLTRVVLKAPAFFALKKATIEAEFQVAKDGTAKVTLVQKTGVADADAQVLEYLKQIQWVPKTVNGQPVADVVSMDFSVAR